MSLSAYESQVSALLNEEERIAMEFFIACAPEDHPVIPGTGGFRKARWAQLGRGKSGGVREQQEEDNDNERTHSEGWSQTANQAGAGAGRKRQGNSRSREGREGTSYQTDLAAGGCRCEAYSSEGRNVSGGVCARLLHQPTDAPGMGARPQKTGCNDPCLPRSNRQESRGGVRGAGAVKMWEPAQWGNASVPFRPSLFAKESVGRRKRPMPHTFCNSNIQAPTPQRLRHPTGPNSLLEGRRTGEKPATNSVGCNAIDEDFEPAFFASQKVCGIRQDCPPHNYCFCLFRVIAPPRSMPASLVVVSVISSPLMVPVVVNFTTLPPMSTCSQKEILSD